MSGKKKVIVAVLTFTMLFYFVVALPSQEVSQSENPFLLFLPVSYDLLLLEDQTVHSPGGGIGFILGEQGQPFDQIERQFFGIALYQPLFFNEVPYPDIPQHLHQIRAIFDGRIKRHQLLAILQSNSDKPFSGFNTFIAGAGWGYEVIRKPQVSLILGALAGIGDMGFTLPSGDPLLVTPLPLIRFGYESKWLSLDFDFITGPNFDITIAPRERLRMSVEMGAENYRYFGDLVCEFTLWYRFFTDQHRLGDFAGIGLGFKNDSSNFDLATNGAGIETFELHQTSVFATLDLSLLTIQGGWVFDSRYFVNDQRTGSPGRGFYLSVQGMIPILNKGMNNNGRGE